ncbi:hypothetical protein [Streptomyces caeni]
MRGLGDDRLPSLGHWSVSPRGADLGDGCGYSGVEVGILEGGDPAAELL